MVGLGFTLLLVGAALVVAEAHVPSGAFGVIGGVALMAGGIVAITALGGGLWVALPVALALGTVAGGWAYVTARTAGSWRGARVRAGAEALYGRIGVVKRWAGQSGQVFVEGALWRACDDWDEDGVVLHEGDQVVVHGVRGLTLSVRRAEDWELLG